MADDTRMSLLLLTLLFAAPISTEPSAEAVATPDWHDPDIDAETGARRQIATHARPHEFGAVHAGVGWQGGLPEVTGLVAIRAIPYVEVEAGVGTLIFSLSAHVRGGPRIRLADFRNQSNRGWAMYGSALGGFRWHTDYSGASWTGLNLGGAFDAIYWFGPHLGLDLRLSAGATILTSRESYGGGSLLRYQPGPEPDFILSLGFAF